MMRHNRVSGFVFVCKLTRWDLEAPSKKPDLYWLSSHNVVFIPMIQMPSVKHYKPIAWEVRVLLLFRECDQKGEGHNSGSGRGGGPDPAFPPLFRENSASCTFFISFLNPAFLSWYIIIAGRSAGDPAHISLRFKQRYGTETLKCLSSRILKVKGERRKNMKVFLSSIRFLGIFLLSIYVQL